ncbi:hypothetical protein [Rhodomicrobium sp.]|uniref:hypothetical protein n=1 Tax=Rhodomicrobium sp. TaxID=2720632 RepID=UPI0039E30B89
MEWNLGLLTPDNGIDSQLKTRSRHDFECEQNFPEAMRSRRLDNTPPPETRDAGQKPGRAILLADRARTASCRKSDTARRFMFQMAIISAPNRIWCS